MLVIGENEINKVLSMGKAVDLVKEGFSAHSKGNTQSPLRTFLDLKKENGSVLFMPGSVEMDEGSAACIKVISFYPDNVKNGLPLLNAIIVVIDVTTGIARAVLDGTAITKIRTAAAQGVATDLLAIKNPEKGAIIGAGGQSFHQVEAMLTVRKFKEIAIYDYYPEYAKSLCDRLKESFTDSSVEFSVASSSKEAVRDADVITAVTTACNPVFEFTDLKEGVHVNGVGSFKPEMQELPSELLVNADKIFVDSIEAVLSEAGDFIVPIGKGMFSKEIISGELGELINGNMPGRKSHKEVTVFKTVGIAVQDVVCSDFVFKECAK